MKKLLIMCGTGVATSTVVVGKVNNWLKENGFEKKVKVYQSKISDELGRIDDYDIIISTTLVPDKLKERVIDGLPLLTGINVNVMYERLRKEIES
jgi:galactitol PTS system EIIB component